MALTPILLSWHGLKIISDLWFGYWSEHQGERSNIFFFSIYIITVLVDSLRTMVSSMSEFIINAIYYLYGYYDSFA